MIAKLFLHETYRNIDKKINVVTTEFQTEAEFLRWLIFINDFITERNVIELVETPIGDFGGNIRSFRPVFSESNIKIFFSALLYGSEKQLDL